MTAAMATRPTSMKVAAKTLNQSANSTERTDMVRPKTRAFLGAILPLGSGLFLVLFIMASMSLSW